MNIDTTNSFKIMYALVQDLYALIHRGGFDEKFEKTVCIISSYVELFV